MTYPQNNAPGVSGLAPDGASVTGGVAETMANGQGQYTADSIESRPSAEIHAELGRLKDIAKVAEGINQTPAIVNFAHYYGRSVGNSRTLDKAVAEVAEEVWGDVDMHGVPEWAAQIREAIEAGMRRPVICDWGAPELVSAEVIRALGEQREQEKANAIERRRRRARCAVDAEEADTLAWDTELYDAADLDAMPEYEPLIHGWLNKDSEARVFGPSGHGKSFLVLDWACHIATGRPWLKRYEVERGRVLYIVGEGARGVRKRVQAWQQHHGAEIPRGQLTIKGLPVQLRTPQQLLEVVRRERYDLVILDTQARMTVGLEENSASDWGVVTEAIRQIRQAGDGTSVLLVHHTGKDEGGPRGTSAGTGALDWEYKVTQRDAEVTVLLDKSKDDKDKVQVVVRRHVVELPGGVTSCVLAAEDPMTRRPQLQPLTQLPPGVPHHEGMPLAVDLFRQKFETDPSGGYTKAQLREEFIHDHSGNLDDKAKRALRKRADRCFSALRGGDHIVAADENTTGREDGKHRWMGPLDKLPLTGDRGGDTTVPVSPVLSPGTDGGQPVTPQVRAVTRG